MDGKQGPGDVLEAYPHGSVRMVTGGMKRILLTPSQHGENRENGHRVLPKVS